MPNSPCAITIASVTETGGGSVNNIAITGTATGCSQVSVQIFCQPVGLQNTVVAPVDQQGNWSAVVPSKCVCGSPITVDATCVGNSSCTATYTVTFPCNDCCPTLTYTTQFGPCQPNGRSVIVNYTITGATDPSCTDGYKGILNFPGSGLAQIHVGVMPNTVDTGSVTLFLPIGATQTIMLTQSPGGGMVCDQVTLSFVVPACTDDCCPSLSLSKKFGPCLPGGRQVTIYYTITATTDPACIGNYSGTLTLGSTLIPLSIPGNSTFSGSTSLFLPIGSNVTATLVQTGQDDFACGPVDLSFKVPDCSSDCCPTAVVTRKVRDCDQDYNKRHMLVKADIVSPCGATIDATMEIEGTVIASGSGVGTLTIQGEGDYTCGHHDVTITVNGCPDIGGTICVPDCESFACLALRLTVLAALGSAIILWILYAVHSAIKGVLFFLIPVTNILFWAALIATGVAVVAAIAWLPCLRYCRKCKLLLLCWQLILVVLCGLFFFIKGFWSYLILAYTVSSFWGYLLLILILLIVILLLALAVYLLFNHWKDLCCPQKCERLKELWFAFFAGFGIALTAALSISAIWATWRWWVIVWLVGIFMFYFSIYVLSCQETDDWE